MGPIIAKLFRFFNPKCIYVKRVSKCETDPFTCSRNSRKDEEDLVYITLDKGFKASDMMNDTDAVNELIKRRREEEAAKNPTAVETDLKEIACGDPDHSGSLFE